MDSNKAYRMKLSIIIPCYNEQHTIASLVAAVNAAPYPDKEIIIVDDCSRDGTHAELEKLKDQVSILVGCALVLRF